VARLLVYVLPVPGEFLGTSKTSLAIGTDSLRPAVRATTAAILDAMGNYMPPGPAELSLRYVNLYSHHGKPGNTYSTS
jgi:hypothetical protein